LSTSLPKSKDRRLEFIQILATLGGLLSITVAVQKFDSPLEQQSFGFFVVVFILASLFTYSFILYGERTLWKYRLSVALLAGSFGALLTFALSISLIPALAVWLVTGSTILFGQTTPNSAIAIVAFIMVFFLIFFSLLYRYVISRLNRLVDWEDIQEPDFIGYAVGIQVIWTHSFANTTTRFRKAVIDTDYDFRGLMMDACLPWYYDSKGADCSVADPKAVNFTVKKWIKKRKKTIVPIKVPQKELVVVTAFDTYLRKRLVVDGNKRCVAVAKDGLRKSKVTRVLVVEAYGDAIRDVFKIDFDNLQK